ncbi:DUF6270 domain-containing protein [Terribacillus sp. 179-K 1B1 HS]
MAVYGSCVSRDVFNSRFVHDHKEHFRIVCDQQHVSLISLMSPAIDLDTDHLEGDVSAFYKEVFKQDLSKVFLEELTEAKQEWLLVDFYTDAYYGACLLQEGSYITNKLWQYKKLHVFEQLSPLKSFSFEEHTMEFLTLWKQAFDAFVRVLNDRSPDTKIIVNQAKFIDNLMMDGKETRLSDVRKDPFCIDQINYIWRMMDEYAITNHSARGMHFDREAYHLIDHHPWGKFYVHYNQAYYLDVRDKLLDIMERK